MAKETSNGFNGIGLNGMGIDFSNMDPNDIAKIIKDLDQKLKDLNERHNNTPESERDGLAFLGLIQDQIANAEAQKEGLEKLVKIYSKQENPTKEQERLLNDTSKKVDILGDAISKKEEQFAKFEERYRQTHGYSEFNNPSDEVDEENGQPTSYGSRKVTDAEGNTYEGPRSYQKEFYIVDFGGKTKRDIDGEYIIASPIGGDDSNPDVQQYVKIYLSQEMAKNSSYRENLKNLKGSQNFVTKLLVSDIDDGSYEAFEVFPPLGADEKTISIATFGKDGKIDSQKDAELGKEAKNGILDHLFLKMDQKVSEDLSALASITSPQATKNILNEADPLRILKLKPENPTMLEMHKDHKITEAELESFYQKSTDNQSLQDLISGKLSTPITVDGKQVTHINQDLMMTPMQQLPKDLQAQMANNKELYMAVLLGRAVQRSLADKIVKQNEGLLYQEMESLYDIKDSLGSWLLPRVSKEDRYDAFDKKKLKKINEEFAQLSAFRGVSRLAAINVQGQQGTSISDRPAIGERDGIDETILDENGNLILEGGKTVPLTAGAYFGRRNQEAEIISTQNPREIAQRRALGQKTSMGVIVDGFDMIRLKSGQPFFGQTTPLMDDKGWAALASALAAFGDDTVKEMVEGIDSAFTGFN